MASVDSFFGFVDKHFKQIIIAICALIIYKRIQSTVPSDDDKKLESEENKRIDVNARLTPPPAPKPGVDGKVTDAQLHAYNTANKAHRSALYASELWNLMHAVGRVPNVPYVNSEEILVVSLNLALFRITLDQLAADYQALQDSPTFWWVGDRTKLTADLRHALSAADYITFMKRLGLTPEQAYAQIHKK